MFIIVIISLLLFIFLKCSLILPYSDLFHSQNRHLDSCSNKQKRTKNSPYFFQLILEAIIPWKKLQILSQKRQKK